MRARRSRSRIVATALAAGVLFASACSSEGTLAGAERDGQPGAGSSAGVATDLGVTADPCPGAVNPDNGCIYLGILSDITEGPFSSLGVEVVSGNEAFWAAVNASGGLGGFDINVTRYTRDNKFDAQEHREQYRTIAPHVLAMAQVLGPPSTPGSLEPMIADEVVAVPASWWSGSVFEQTVLGSGASDCLAAMNGLDWASTIDEDFVDGPVESVMVVRFDEEHGNEVAAGVLHWATTNAVNFTPGDDVTTNASTDGDQLSTIEALVTRDPQVVVLATGAIEAVEIIAGAVEGGFDGRFLATGRAWDPALMSNEDVADSLERVLRLVAPWASFGGSSPAHQAMSAAVGDDPPANDGFTSGWIWQYPLKSAIEQALADGDLTRQGLRAAALKVTVDYAGALPDRRYGRGVDDAFRQNIIGRPDADETFGISSDGEYFSGSTAEAFPYLGPCAG